MEIKGSSFFQDAFSRLLESNPVSLLARLAMERAFSARELDHVFETHRADQYTRDLLFSSTVSLMGKVVLGKRSVRSVYLEGQRTEHLAVSLQAVYDKLQGVEPGVCQALVQHSATRAAQVLVQLRGSRPEPLPGWRLRLLDGNHLAASERRLAALRDSWAGPLPGFALVVFDPATELVLHALPCEDGHAQERSLTDPVLALVQPGECWVADRNFCTTSLLRGVAAANAAFVLRQHGNLEVRAEGVRQICGRTDRGEVSEQSVVLDEGKGKGKGALRLRRITVRLDKSTRDGDRELHLLTNLPATVSATTIAEIYRKRWRIETAFAQLEKWLRAEIAPLGYPRAALFGFCVGLMAYNMLSTLRGALRAAHGDEKVENMSGALLVDDLQGNERGLGTLLPAKEWRPFHSMALEAFAALLLEIASHVKLAWYPKAKRGPKKPRTERTRAVGQPHVSTYQILRGHGQEGG